MNPDLPSLSLAEQTTTDRRNIAEPTIKITTIEKAYPSYPAILNGPGFGGDGGGAGQLSSQSTQLQAGVKGYNENDTFWKQVLYTNKKVSNI